MSNQHLKWIAVTKTGSPTSRSIMRILCDMADANSICWPSQAYLAESSEYSVPTVKRALKELEAGGFLAVLRVRSKNCYFLPVVDEQGSLLMSADEHLKSKNAISDCEAEDENIDSESGDEGISVIPSGGQSDTSSADTKCQSDTSEVSERYLPSVSVIPDRGQSDTSSRTRNTRVRVLTPINPQGILKESSSSSVQEKTGASEVSGSVFEDDDYSSVVFRNLKYPPTPERYREQLVRFHENARLWLKDLSLSFDDVKAAVEQAILASSEPVGNLHAFGMAVIKNPRTFKETNLQLASQGSGFGVGLSRKEKDLAFLKDAYERSIAEEQDQSLPGVGALGAVSQEGVGYAGA
ncbi:MAG: helix-turn-helix domain-containing protein [Micrococcaceae bacterium]